MRNLPSRELPHIVRLIEMPVRRSISDPDRAEPDGRRTPRGVPLPDCGTAPAYKRTCAKRSRPFASPPKSMKGHVLSSSIQRLPWVSLTSAARPKGVGMPDASYCLHARPDSPAQTPGIRGWAPEFPPSIRQVSSGLHEVPQPWAAHRRCRAGLPCARARIC